MISKNSLFAVVIWYNPSPENIEAIESYIHEINQLIIIDNSSVSHAIIIKQKEWNNVIYVPNYANKGVATGLNQGCNIAIHHGASWVLTMDQDSSFHPNGVLKLIEKANNYPEFDHVAIFAPRLYVEGTTKPLKKKNAYSREEEVVTSGNLLSLAAFQNTGNFLDEFFIDLVDAEFCIRLEQKGYQIVMINTVLLKHSFGDGWKICHFCFFKKAYIDYPPVRQYYIIRNSLYLCLLYKNKQMKYLKHIGKQLKRVILYDHKNKWQKLKYMRIGLIDYTKGKKGAFK